MELSCNDLLYFIKYIADKVRTQISQGFLAKKYFYFSKLISQKFIIASLFIIKAILKPFLSYLPCIVCRGYFSIIFNVKKCALYLIKYGTVKTYFIMFGWFEIQNNTHKRIKNFTHSNTVDPFQLLSYWLNSQRQCAFSGHKNWEPNPGPVLPPGVRNWQLLISHHWKWRRNEVSLWNRRLVTKKF